MANERLSVDWSREYRSSHGGQYRRFKKRAVHKHDRRAFRDGAANAVFESGNAVTNPAAMQFDAAHFIGGSVFVISGNQAYLVS